MQFIVSSGPNSSPIGQPMDLETIFSYILLGPVRANNSSSCTSVLSVTPSLDTLVQHFWEIEGISPKPVANKEDILAEEHFVSTLIIEIHLVDMKFRFPLGVMPIFFNFLIEL